RCLSDWSSDVCSSDLPWFFQRENTSLGRFVKEETTAVDYLKTLAVSRIYLDNILNVQASWLTPGHKICQIALRFGGNDVGSILKIGRASCRERVYVAV